MVLTKQSAFTKKTTDLPDVPSPTYTATQIKDYIQNPSDELMTNFNNAIDKLNSTTDGNSGADNIGATGFDGKASTPQAMLEDLNTRKPDKGTDWTGTWQGYTPSKADPGISSVVEQHTSQLADIVTDINSYPIQIPEVDDTGRIQRAVNALKNIGGGTLLIPYGTFNVSGTIDCTGDVPISIKGTGMTTSQIKVTISTDIPIFHFGKTWTGSESSGWSRIYDFSILRSMADKTTASAIVYDSANPKLVIDHLNIDGFKNGIDINNCWGTTISNCFVSNCGTGINLERQPNGTLVQACYMQRCDTGVLIDDGAATTLQNVVIERYTLSGVVIIRGKSVQLSNCYFEGADATADSTINITRKSGYTSSTVTIDNCHFNDSVLTIIRGQAVDELTVTNNVLYTPPNGVVLVLSDTTVLSDGIGVCRLWGNTTQYWEGGTDNTTLKYLYQRKAGDGNVEKGTFILGSNGEFSKKGLIYNGTIDLTANGKIIDARKYKMSYGVWSPKDTTDYAIPSYRDAGTATPNFSDSGYNTIKLVHGGTSSWGSTAYIKAIPMSKLQELFGSTGLIRLKLSAMGKNAKILAVQTSGSSYSNIYTSSKANSSYYELLELEFSLNLANASDYKIGLQVDANETGFICPIKIAVLGTKDEGEIIDSF